MSDNPTRAHRRAGALTRVRALPAWTLIAAGAVTGGLAGAGYALATPAEYSATSYVVAVPAEGADSSAALGFAQAYGRVAGQLAVLGDAQVSAGVPVSTLRSSVRAETSPDAPMISVTAVSDRPERAADMANAVARALTRHADEARGATHVELEQFARAVRPAEPSSLPPSVTGLVGACAGGLLGALLLLARPRREEREPARAAQVPGPALAAETHGRL
jgi:capsular polysaccharide biosynthesis protein